jgi:FxsC-like protein
MGDRLPRLEQYEDLSAVPNAFLDQEPIGRIVGPEPPATIAQSETGVRCVYVAPKQSEVEPLKVRMVKLVGKERPLRTNTASYGSAGGWHWQPYQPPVEVKIGSLVQQLVSNFQYREILLQDEDQPDLTVDDVIRKLRVAAENDQIILLVVDVWSVYLERYQEFLVKFNAAIPMKSAVVVVPWNEGDSDTVELREILERQLRDLFKNQYLGTQPFSPFFKPKVTTIEDFRAILSSVLETIRIGIETYRAAQHPIIESGGSAPEVRSSRAGS